MAAYSDGSPKGSKTQAQAISDAKKRKKPAGKGGKFQPPKSPGRQAGDVF